jgi:hypothetical protein
MARANLMGSSSASSLGTAAVERKFYDSFATEDTQERRAVAVTLVTGRER